MPVITWLSQNISCHDNLFSKIGQDDTNKFSMGNQVSGSYISVALCKRKYSKEALKVIPI